MSDLLFYYCQIVGYVAFTGCLPVLPSILLHYNEFILYQFPGIGENIIVGYIISQP